MKILLPTVPPSVVIPTSNRGMRRGPDSRGIRICVAQIGRSCLLQQGYVTFTDGSAYVYDAPSNEEFEELCASLQRGAQFNFDVRRAVVGFTKGFTPPGDYEIIYSYPPYPGTTPTACGVTPSAWPLFTAIQVQTVPTTPSISSILFDGPPSSFVDWTTGNSPVSLAVDVSVICTSSYVGSGQTSHLEILSSTGDSSVNGTINLIVTQDGTELINVTHNTASFFDYTDDFDFADTMGSTSTIVFTYRWQSPDLKFPFFEGKIFFAPS